MTMKQEEPLDGVKHDDVVQKVARASEPLLSLASLAAAAAAIAAAATDSIPIAGPLVAAGVTGLLPVVSATIERRREERSGLAARARTYADEAWAHARSEHVG